jgi:toprim domain protein
MGDGWVIVVEGKHDRARVQQVAPQAVVVATNGWPSQERLSRLRHQAKGRQVALLTDADPAGRKIRAALREVFPDSVDVFVRRSFNGVEHAPLPYLARCLYRAGIIENLTSDAMFANVQRNRSIRKEVRDG